METKRKAEVSAAMIERDGFVLLCRRSAGSSRPLKWEFPGGKLEPGETGQEALVREIKEELDCTVSVGESLCGVRFDYPDITIHMTLYRCRIVSGEPKPLEHDRILWVRLEDVPSFELCPADREMINKLGG